MADRVKPSHHRKRSRSLSPRRRDSSHLESYRARSPPHRHHHRKEHTSNTAPALLPFNSRELTKRDYGVFRPMFGLYLDVQKGKLLDEMEETEVKGRWKSFLGKWNRGELAEGWYDPATLEKARQSESSFAADALGNETPRSPHRSMNISARATVEESREEGSESDDSVGPMLPGHDASSRRNRVGPSIPNLQDLELKQELAAEDSLAARDDIRYERRLDRKAQKAALDELVPRAEAGTRERQLEKKKEVNEKMKGFRERSPGAAEVPDTELMGGGDSVSDYKRVKQEAERKKTEREVRREEILRARTAEREERMSEYRAKEDKTMDMLRALAKQRFG